MEEKKKFSFTPWIMIFVFIIALAGLKWNIDTKLNRLEQKINLRDTANLYDTTTQMGDEIERLRIKVNRLENENLELWFSRMDHETKDSIIQTSQDFGCQWSDKGIQNNFFGMVENKDYEYLRLSSDRGTALFNSEGVSVCFDAERKPIDCNNLCAEIVIEPIEEFENGTR